MGKLKELTPRLGTLPSRVAQAPADEAGRSRFRDAQAPWRAWYRTARWQALRLAVLLRDGWRCQWPGCGVVLRPGRDDPRSAVVDHIRAHRGDAALFWDESNLTALCKACHDGPKQAQERREG